jgi:Bacterial regulatory proteins, gntR family
MATAMGVSRTVVREAVAALLADGVVTTRQGAGTEEGSARRGMSGAADYPTARPNTGVFVRCAGSCLIRYSKIGISAEIPLTFS